MEYYVGLDVMRPVRGRFFSLILFERLSFCSEGVKILAAALPALTGDALVRAGGVFLGANRP